MSKTLPPCPFDAWAQAVNGTFDVLLAPVGHIHEPPADGDPAHRLEVFLALAQRVQLNPELFEPWRGIEAKLVTVLPRRLAEATAELLYNILAGAVDDTLRKAPGGYIDDIFRPASLPPSIVHTLNLADVDQAPQGPRAMVAYYRDIPDDHPLRQRLAEWEALKLDSGPVAVIGPAIPIRGIAPRWAAPAWVDARQAAALTRRLSGEWEGRKIGAKIEQLKKDLKAVDLKARPAA